LDKVTVIIGNTILLWRIPFLVAQLFLNFLWRIGMISQDFGGIKPVSIEFSTPTQALNTSTNQLYLQKITQKKFS
jgi:hypothetical protein